MSELKVGIADYAQMKARTMAIARGEYRPAPGEPKVWFTSIESLAKVYSTGNQELLSIIALRQPCSITELAEMTGREKSNLSRTLKTMERYGFVRLDKDERGRIRPSVTFDRLSLVLPLAKSAPG